jgi:hypothetical protein
VRVSVCECVWYDVSIGGVCECWVPKVLWTRVERCYYPSEARCSVVLVVTSRTK